MPNEINARELLDGLDDHEIATATGRPSTKVPAAGEVNAWWVDEKRPRFWHRDHRLETYEGACQCLSR